MFPKKGRRRQLVCLLIVVALLLVCSAIFWYFKLSHSRVPRTLVESKLSDWTWPPRDPGVTDGIIAFFADWEQVDFSDVSTVEVPSRKGTTMVFDFVRDGGAPLDVIRVDDWTALYDAMRAVKNQTAWTWTGHGLPGKFLAHDSDHPASSTIVPELDENSLNQFRRLYGTFLISQGPPQRGRDRQLEAQASCLSLVRARKPKFLELYVCELGESTALPRRLAYCLPGTTVIAYKWRVYWSFGYRIYIRSATAYRRDP
jgi:hypothetical protein